MSDAEQSVLLSTAARFQRERDWAIDRWDTLRQERDEARALARRLLKLGTWERLTARFLEEFPWLPE